MQDFRIGQGIDVHQLAEGRELYLGGVKIPFDKGLSGHSDADVALHALCDALLGAAAMRDIGFHFPDTDPAYEGADSRGLLRTVRQMLSDAGYLISNVDVTIVAQAPKVAPYVPRMVENIAADLLVPCERVSVKATTTEHLGFIGQGEGIAAFAVALIAKTR